MSYAYYVTCTQIFSPDNVRKHSNSVIAVFVQLLKSILQPIATLYVIIANYEIAKYIHKCRYQGQEAGGAPSKVYL